jgi:hypothetical protein
MTSKPNWGVDHETHALLEIRQPPPSIIALRDELEKLRTSHNEQDRKLYEKVKAENTFEGCIGELAAGLDILLDGMYDVEPLCGVLVDCLRKRHLNINQPHLRNNQLVNVELVERADTVGILEVEGDIGTIAKRVEASGPVLKPTDEQRQIDTLADAGIAAAERREFLGKNIPSCRCGSKQVQLRNGADKPAVWKCRSCKTRWEWEPPPLVIQ